jgi:hypothetical protein
MKITFRKNAGRKNAKANNETPTKGTDPLATPGEGWMEM